MIVPDKLRIVVVDDDGDLRFMVRAALELQSDLEVVAKAGTGAEALVAVEACEPHAVILDLALPDVAGQDVLAAIRERQPRCRVIVFTGNDTVTAEELLARGAAGFVLKDGDVRRLVEVVRDVAGSAPIAAAVQLGRAAASARAARQFVSDFCEEFGCGEGVTDSAVLLVSELVTNAVIHAEAAPQLRLRLTDAVLRIEVFDAGAGSPDVQEFSTTAEHGRGMFLVSAMAQAWGIDPEDDGKLVWAELVRT